ncbi:MAG TPA: nickel pincer cofactor biosynthesis protein LarB [Thermoanaerobaculia bacterium]|nr:nickel pincer cofactor biosynthesis protein LarB [Thermoanaerobaculia bacterium]
MNPRQLRELLEAVAAGARSPEAALADLAELPYADLGFAKLDLHRELRNGHPEAVYAEGKRIEDLLEITARFLAAHGRVLVTRLSREGAAALVEAQPQATYHERARVLTAGTPREPLPGNIAVLAAGTSDLAVAEEAAVCAAWFGHTVTRTFDVGVAGLHRLLGNLAEVRRADVVVAVAGMDGALPTVVASLVAAPVVAVPTSVGYGASFGGLAALLTMLNGCAPGVGVVNIDNGFGAAVLASRIARRIGVRLDPESAQPIARSASMASP